MIKRRLTYYILATVALFGAGCAKVVEEPAGAREMTFYTRIDHSLPNSAKTQTATRAVSADLNTTGVLINGFYSTVSLSKMNFAADAKPIFSKLEVDGSGSYPGSRYFWASTLKYHFFGYNNIGSVTEETQPCGVIADDPGANGGTITFVQTNDPQTMYDLVLSKPIWNKQSNEGIVQDVELVFQHVLSKINFNIYNPNMTQLNNCKFYLSFAENTFKRKASFTLYDQMVTLDNTLFHSGTHLLSPPFDVPGTATDIDKAWFAGDIILLPQEMPYGSITLKVEYTIDGTKEEKTVEVPMPSGKFAAGYSYTYSLLIDAKAANLKVISLQLLPWDIIYSADIPMFDY